MLAGKLVLAYKKPFFKQPLQLHKSLIFQQATAILYFSLGMEQLLLESYLYAWMTVNNWAGDGM